MDSTNHKRLQSLLSIISTSNIMTPISSPDLTSSPYPADHPALPPPPDVLPELEATGAPASMITELLQWYNQACRSFRRQTEATLANLPITSTRTFCIFEEAYIKRVNTLKDRMLQRVYGTSSKRPSKFNQKCIPLLEKYFKDNAYPSAADRAMLAQKTRMTLRQIDVWFQNHRARGKRDGITLRRRSYDANPDDYTLDSLEQATPCPTPPRRSHSILNSSPEIGDKTNYPEDASNRATPISAVFRWISHTPVDIIKVPPPSHAFPTPFPPKDPLPLTPRISTFDWERKPSTIPKPTSNSKHVDIDAFINDFKMQLRIFEQPQMSSLKRKRSNDSVDSSVSPRKKTTTSHSAPHRHPSLNTSQSLTQPDLVRSPAGRTRPSRRTLVSNPRRPSSSSISSTSSRSCSESSDSWSPAFLPSNRSYPASSVSSVRSPTSPDLKTGPLASLPSQLFLSQRLSWHTSKFVQWSSLPALTLNFVPSNFPVCFRYN